MGWEREIKIIKINGDGEWRGSGKCVRLGKSMDFFFPHSGQKGRAKDISNETLQAESARFCKGTNDGEVCPVIEECKTYAIVNNLEGVFGGTTEKERRKIRRAAAKAA